MKIGKDSGEDDNPYLAARRSWNDHVGGLAASRRLWQIMAIGALLVTAGAVGGLIEIGSQSKFVPYVVRVNELGDETPVSRADLAAPVDKRVAQAQVAAFVSAARSVTPDVAVARAYASRVYAMLQTGDAAKYKMDQWFNGTPASPPLVRAQTMTVEARIMAVIPQSESSWQVDWQEIARDRSGQLLHPPVMMRALVSVKVIAATPETTEADIRSNPLGIFVTDFSWGPVS